MSGKSATNDHRRSGHELLHRLHNLDDLIRASDGDNVHRRPLPDRRRIPPLPDLRFEYSYLRSVRQYVALEWPPPPAPSSADKGKEKAEEGEPEMTVTEVGGGGGLEVVRVQWGQVLWITTRDQLLSPFAQGALWGVASHFLRPLGAMLGTQIREWWARGASRGKNAPEGNGVQWLRNWMSSILTPAPATGTPSSIHAR